MSLTPSLDVRDRLEKLAAEARRLRSLPRLGKWLQTRGTRDATVGGLRL